MHSSYRHYMLLWFIKGSSQWIVDISVCSACMYSQQIPVKTLILSYLNSFYICNLILSYLNSSPDFMSGFDDSAKSTDFTFPLAVRNMKFAWHLYTWLALGIKHQTFWFWVQCPVHLGKCLLGNISFSTPLTNIYEWKRRVRYHSNTLYRRCITLSIAMVCLLSLTTKCQ